MPQSKDVEKTVLSTAKVNALGKALAASKLANAERGSPRTRGIQRAKEAIEWTYRWGWTTPTLLEILSGTTRSGLANRLIKNGLLSRIPAPSGGINSTPTFLLTLTQKGLETAVEITDELLPYQTDPHRINFKNVSHDELVQRLTSKYLCFTQESGGIDDYKTPKQLHTWNADSTKIPDAVWVKGKGKDAQEFAVEVELSPKFKVEFDQFVTMTSKNLEPREGDPKPKFAGVYIFYKTTGLFERYQAAFQRGSKVPIWEREPGKTGRWQQKTNGFNGRLFYTVTPHVSSSVKFELITPHLIAADQFQPIYRKPILTIEGL